MKNLKIVLTSLVLAAGVIGFSSFKSENFNKKAFATVCFYYNVASLDKNVVGTTDQLSLTEVITSSNWVSTSDIPPTSPNGDCSTGNYLCAFCYDNSTYTSFSEVLTKIADYYTEFGTLPNNGDISQSDPRGAITTYRQLSQANHQ